MENYFFLANFGDNYFMFVENMLKSYSLLNLSYFTRIKKSDKIYAI